MFLFVFRKMIRNKWMMLSLFLGMILAVAMISSIPVFTNGILQRLLIKDMENVQRSTGIYPGRYTLSVNTGSFYSAGTRASTFEFFDQKITAEGRGDIGLPLISPSTKIAIDHIFALPSVQREEKPAKRFMRIEAARRLPDFVNIIAGDFFSSSLENGIIEVIVNERAMQEKDLLLGEIYDVMDITERLDEPIKLKIVGVFEQKAPDLFWSEGMSNYNESFVMDYDLFDLHFIKTGSSLISQAHWVNSFDYHSLTIENLESVLQKHKDNAQWLSEYRSVTLRFPSEHILKNYQLREKQLLTTLWILQVPIILMLMFYLFMMSQLVIGNDRNEIAVLRSRGASSFQIFKSYMLQSFILGAGALIAGPLLGLLICRILGASNGFLEFVQRTALDVSLGPQAYQYALIAVAVSVLAMLIPAVIYSKDSIVEHKSKKAKKKLPLWKKSGLDIILLLISGYGIYSYRLRSSIIEATGAAGTDIAIDPLLFAMSTVFILGVALLFLRIYPVLVNIVYKIGKKFWPPVMYAGFIQVSRTSGSDIFLMLFLIFTLSIGVFNANAARTINSNTEWRTSYPTGADIVIRAYWEDDSPPETSIFDIGSMAGMPEPAQTGSGTVQYREPPFLPYTQLEGVMSATKVFRQYPVNISKTTSTIRNVSLMGIIPHEFADIAFFRRDFLAHHWYGYLNLMTDAPTAVLLSRSIQTEYGIEKGDVITMEWQGQGNIECIVYEFIDYWPGYNPYDQKQPHLIVANLEYIHSKTSIQPYDVWLKKTSEATSQDVYDSILEKRLNIENIKDTSQDIIAAKNDPILQGLNGVLTLGFILTVVICMAGFFICSLFSIKSRQLQFGILRATGLGKQKVILMLAFEQLLLAGVAVTAGIITGGFTSTLFVPFFEITMSILQKVPPFITVSNRVDYYRIYGIILLMLTGGIILLGMIVSRIKVSQALKLGED